MAYVNLSLGGPYRFNTNSLTKQTVYDNVNDGGAARIAGEYQHGFFTVGGTFNPLHSVGQREALEKYNVGVGDFINLFEIPSLHTLVGVGVRVFAKQLGNRSYDLGMNSDGLVFDVEVRKFDKSTGQESGVVDLVTELNGIVANANGFKRSAVKPGDGGYFIGENEMLMLGLKVVSLPTAEAVRLGDVTCRVELTGHVFDYEAPIHI